MSGARETRRVWRERILLVAGLGLLVYVVSRFPLSTIASACYDVGPAILVTPLIAVLWCTVNSIALGVILDGKVPLRSLLWNRLVGEGFNSLIPAVGVGGEPFKMRHLTRFVSKGTAVVALINDYIIENVVSLVSSSVFLTIGLFVIDLPAGWRDSAIVYIAIAMAIAIAGTIVVLIGVPSKLGSRFKRWLAFLPDGEPLRPRQFARASLWCFAARAVGLVECAMLLWVLGIDPTPMRIAFIGGWTAAAGYISIGIPQGLGVTDAATVIAFELLHLPGPEGIAFALARRGRTLFMSLFGVALYFYGRSRQDPAKPDQALARGDVAEHGGP